MRGVRLWGVGDLRVDDLPDPRPGPGEALLAVGACGVCPSEVRSFAGTRTGSHYDAELPRLLGHEWAGTVLEIVPAPEAPPTPTLSPGDLVAVDWRCPCGSCPMCARGRFDLCEHLRPCVRGGFAELGVAPLSQLVPFPAGTEAETAALTEPLACVVNAQQALGLELGEELVVLGAGPMGLLHVALAKARGLRVLACDPEPERAEAARRVGADEVVASSGEEAIEAVRALSEGARGVDAAIVAVGAAGAVADALAMVAPTGRVDVFAGTYPPSTLSLDPNRIHYPQAVLTGTHDYTPHHFRLAARLLARQVVDAGCIISHRDGLAGTVEAFERVRRHEGLKTMILPAR